MPGLDKAALKAGIKALTATLYTNTTDPAQAREDYAEGMANLLDAFVKSGDGKYQGGLMAGSVPVTAAPGTTVIKTV